MPNTHYRLARGRAVPKTRPAAAKRRAHTAAREWKKAARSATENLLSLAVFALAFGEIRVGVAGRNRPAEMGGGGREAGAAREETSSRRRI